MPLPGDGVECEGRTMSARTVLGVGLAVGAVLGLKFIADGLAGQTEASIKAGLTSALAAPAEKGPRKKVEKVMKTDEEWKAILTPIQYQVLRQKGTERAFTGALWDNHKKGLYVCAACGLELFKSDTKFDSGTGWPSFWAPLDPAHVEEHSDVTLGMRRTETVCARCGGHLGHVFPDGPKPTGQRNCMTSAGLSFVEEK